MMYRPVFKKIAYCGFHEDDTLVNKLKQQGLQIFTLHKTWFSDTRRVFFVSNMSKNGDEEI